MKVFVALILVAAGGQRCYASPLPDEDLVTDASSVHYSYGRQYGYNHGVKGHYAPAYGHRDYGYNYKYKPYRVNNSWNVENVLTRKRDSYLVAAVLNLQRERKIPNTFVKCLANLWHFIFVTG